MLLPPLSLPPPLPPLLPLSLLPLLLPLLLPPPPAFAAPVVSWLLHCMLMGLSVSLSVRTLGTP
jgi:hypothetical protein